MTDGGHSTRGAHRGFTIAGLLILAFLAPSQASAARRCVPPAAFPNAALFSALQRGVNLPGWDDPDPARHPSLAQLQALRGEGFTHVRLLLDNTRLTGPKASVYVDSVYEQVIFLLSLDYGVSLDLHADEKVAALFAQDPAEGTAYLEAIWRRLAVMASSLDPAKVALELLNEPQIGQDDWMRTVDRLVAVIRPLAPDHTIIVGPSGPQRHETLSGMQPLADRNIVYAVHYYDPFLFTHQGATWGGADDPVRLFDGLPFPTALDDPTIQRIIRDFQDRGQTDAVAALKDGLDRPWDERGMAQAFDTMADWGKRHGRPVIINEFGVLSFVAPRQARLDWLAMVNRLSRQRCLGWAHWDFQDGFGLIDPATGLPDAGIMQALDDAD